MKKTFIFLAILASVLAIILLALFIYYLGIIPSITGLMVGLITFFLLKNCSEIKKQFNFSISLAIMVLTTSAYKSIFIKTEITNTKTKLKEKESKSIEIDNIDLIKD